MEENLGEVIQQIPFLGSLPEMRKKAIQEKQRKLWQMIATQWPNRGYMPISVYIPKCSWAAFTTHLSVVFISLVGQEIWNSPYLYVHISNYYKNLLCYSSLKFLKLGEDGRPRYGVDVFVGSSTFTQLFHLAWKILTLFWQSWQSSSDIHKMSRKGKGLRLEQKPFGEDLVESYAEMKTTEEADAMTASRVPTTNEDVLAATYKMKNAVDERFEA